jgi:hypothetical protein
MMLCPALYSGGDLMVEEIPVTADGTPDPGQAIRWIYEPGTFTPLK